jgi:hypothetical protein
MRRISVLFLLGVMAALGLWYGMRGGSSQKAASANVTTLLPRETLAFVHLPDFNRTRDQWHETELYKLWREPAMQEFLQKPMTQMRKAGAAQQRIQELQSLHMRDAFFAITSVENSQPKMMGGFRFKGEKEDAEKVINGWRGQRLDDGAPAPRQTVEYQKHRIDVTADGGLMIATVFDGDWFFAANDLDALKALLDRADKRVTDAATTLSTEENFTAAFAKIPAAYAVFAYGRLDRYFERLAAKLPQDGAATDQATMLRQVKNIAGATSFEGGRIRDVLFVTMPKMNEAADLTRSSLALATAESFLYGASILNLPKQMDLPAAPASSGRGFSAVIQRLVAAFSANGITLDTWNNAFGTELGVIGDWPANSRLPALLATLPVKNAEQANSIMRAMTQAAGADSTWVATEEGGIRYYAQPPANPMVPVAPTVAITNDRAVLGLDRNSVEAALQRSSGASALAGAETFKSAEALVPAAKHSFWYVDTALLYTRLDATVRPMLIMGAAFVPAIAQAVDLSKVPPADVITRHLSPIVLSQTYEGDGYRMESIGPVSIYQAALGIAGVSGAGAAFYNGQLGGGQSAGGVAPNPAPNILPPAPALASPSPNRSPEPGR